MRQMKPNLERRLVMMRDRSYGLVTVLYPVLQVTETVELREQSRIFPTCAELQSNRIAAATDGIIVEVLRKGSG